MSGKAREPSELIYFKVDKSPISVIEQEIETAALMLGSRPSSKTCARHPKNDSLQSRSLAAGPLSYESLRQQILHRDGWECQSCVTRSNLEVHHKEFRSHSGVDSQVNLITLCTACHARLYRR